MNMELLGIVGAFFELTAVFLLGKKFKFGFICNVIGNSCWICYSLISGSAYGLLIVGLIGIILNIKGYMHWRKIL